MYPNIIPLLHVGGLHDTSRLLYLRALAVMFRGEVGGAWRVVNDRGMERSPSPSIVSTNTSNE